MIYSDEELNAIEELAGHGFTCDEICEVMQFEFNVFRLAFKNPFSIVNGVYRKGFLKSQLALRQRIFKDAMHGSSPAQTLAKKIMDDCEFKHNQ